MSSTNETQSKTITVELLKDDKLHFNSSVKGSQGLQILSIDNISPLKEHDIKIGDIITHINGKDIRGMPLQKAISYNTLDKHGNSKTDGEVEFEYVPHVEGPAKFYCTPQPYDAINGNNKNCKVTDDDPEPDIIGNNKNCCWSAHLGNRLVPKECAKYVSFKAREAAEAAKGKTPEERDAAVNEAVNKAAKTRYVKNCILFHNTVVHYYSEDNLTNLTKDIVNHVIKSSESVQDGGNDGIDNKEEAAKKAYITERNKQFKALAESAHEQEYNKKSALEKAEDFLTLFYQTFNGDPVDILVPRDIRQLLQDGNITDDAIRGKMTEILMGEDAADSEIVNTTISSMEDDINGLANGVAPQKASSKEKQQMKTINADVNKYINRLMDGGDLTQEDGKYVYTQQGRNIIISIIKKKLIDFDDPRIQHMFKLYKYMINKMAADPDLFSDLNDDTIQEGGRKGWVGKFLDGCCMIVGGFVGVVAGSFGMLGQMTCFVLYGLAWGITSSGTEANKFGNRIGVNKIVNDISHTGFKGLVGLVDFVFGALEFLFSFFSIFTGKGGGKQRGGWGNVYSQDSIQKKKTEIENNKYCIKTIKREELTLPVLFKCKAITCFNNIRPFAEYAWAEGWNFSMSRTKSDTDYRVSVFLPKMGLFKQYDKERAKQDVDLLDSIKGGSLLGKQTRKKNNKRKTRKYKKKRRVSKRKKRKTNKK